MLRASRVVQGVPQARAFRLSPHGVYPTLLLPMVARACAASFLYSHPSTPLPQSPSPPERASSHTATAWPGTRTPAPPSSRRACEWGRSELGPFSSRAAPPRPSRSRAYHLLARRAGGDFGREGERAGDRVAGGEANEDGGAGSRVTGGEAGEDSGAGSGAATAAARALSAAGAGPRRSGQAQHPQSAAALHAGHARELHVGGLGGLLPLVRRGRGPGLQAGGRALQVRRAGAGGASRSGGRGALLPGPRAAGAAAGLGGVHAPAPPLRTAAPLGLCAGAA